MKSASSNSELKKQAGYWAADQVMMGDTVGVGTGSTVYFFIERLAQRVRDEGLKIRAITTSFQSSCLCAELGIPVLDITSVKYVDIAVDGADNIDPELDLIKGGGAAQTLEKIVAAMAKKYIIIADESKSVEYLGQTFMLPVEVLPRALNLVGNKLEEMGLEYNLRMGKAKDGPVVTDNGNFVIDIKLQAPYNKAELNSKITMIPGVVETGFFIGYAQTVCLACKDGLKFLNRK